MSTLTKEWLQKTIAELEEERDATPGAVNEDAAKALAAMKIALASLEAEPVVFRSKLKPPSAIGSENWDYTDHRQPDAFELESCVIERLYTAPPAPVSVPDDVSGPLAHAYKELTPTFMRNHIDVFERYGIYPDGSAGIQAMRIALDGMSRRAAMLQGAGRPQNEPQNIPENIPATQFKPVADLYGLTSPTGGETSFTFDAVEARDFIDGGWSCQEYVELGRFQEALTDHSEGDLDMVRPVMFIDGNLLPGDAEKLKAAIEELNHSGEPTIMIAGDSPVIPDGWVMVPEDPTHEMLEAGDEQFGTYDVYRRMIEAAPKLE
ncbi:hypothetical protein [Enterobacter chuandaensis]|uniref:hypothetical protein n=1 Tax=Enterobacter chuandaensis TaxID=2497875 RepID=UPI00300D79AE